MTKFSFFYILPFFIYLLCPFPIFASPIITEVHPNPLTGPEWVEIYNPDQTTISLTHWVLEDQLSAPSVALILGQQVTLEPHNYLVLELPSSKLNNTSDGVTLKDAAGAIIDAMSYTTTTVGQSWARTSEYQANFFLTTPTPNAPTTLPSPTASPTPTSPTPTPANTPTPTPSPLATPTPTPTSYPLNLQPSEIMACPGDQDTEWLEIYNPNDVDISMANWYITDTSNSTRILNGALPAHSYAALTWTGSLLNNTGDTFTLLTPEDTPLFTVVITACQKNQSFIFYEDAWRLTTTVTKDASNIFHAVTNTPTPSPSTTKTSSTLTASPTPTQKPSGHQPATNLSNSFLDMQNIPLSALPALPMLPTLTTFSPYPISPHQIQTQASHSLHPFADSFLTIHASTWPLTLPKFKLAILSVIIGGALLLSINTAVFYYYFGLFAQIKQIRQKFSNTSHHAQPLFLFP